MIGLTRTFKRAAASIVPMTGIGVTLLDAPR